MDELVCKSRNYLLHLKSIHSLKFKTGTLLLSIHKRYRLTIVKVVKERYCKCESCNNEMHLQIFKIQTTLIIN